MSPYTTTLADPPWEYAQPLKMADGVKRSSVSQYPTMSVQQVCDLYVPSQRGPRGELQRQGLLAGHVIADTALLGLWITPPMLLEGIHNRVCACWGFTPRQVVPWIKGRLAVEEQQIGIEWKSVPKLVIQPGMGHLTRGCVEYLVLATRGQYTKLVKSRSINGLLIAEEDAFIVEPKSKHSRKPNAAYSLLENLFPGPYLELFAREYREGWDVWGNELPNGPDFPAYEPAPADDVEIIEWP